VIKEGRQAVILAGGKGSRLRPYTAILPKPLMPVGEIPILEVVITQLKRDGFTEIIMAVGYLASLIEAYFGDGKRWGVTIRYSHEPEPLGTVGPLAGIEDLRPPVLVMNGDILTNLSYSNFMDFHNNAGGMLSVALHKRNIDVTLGVVEVDEKNTINSYTEKPQLNYLASMGVYAFGADALNMIEKGSHMDLPDLIKLMISKNMPTKGFVFDGLWLDIGRREDHENAIEIFESRKNEFLPQ
jgi:NDP-mannose synthase